MTRAALAVTIAAVLACGGRDNVTYTCRQQEVAAGQAVPPWCMVLNVRPDETALMEAACTHLNAGVWGVSACPDQGRVGTCVLTSLPVMDQASSGALVVVSLALKDGDTVSLAFYESTQSDVTDGPSFCASRRGTWYSR